MAAKEQALSGDTLAATLQITERKIIERTQPKISWRQRTKALSIKQLAATTKHFVSIEEDNTNHRKEQTQAERVQETPKIREDQG